MGAGQFGRWWVNVASFTWCETLEFGMERAVHGLIALIPNQVGGFSDINDMVIRGENADI